MVIIPVKHISNSTKGFEILTKGMWNYVCFYPRLFGEQSELVQRDER